MRIYFGIAFAGGGTSGAAGVGFAGGAAGVGAVAGDVSAVFTASTSRFSDSNCVPVKS